MACIRSGMWLAGKGEPKEIAERTGVSFSKIKEIIKGEDIGSIKDWVKIFKVYPNLPKMSYDTDEIIGELYQVTQASGQVNLNLYYEIKNDCIVFVDFLTEDEIKKYGVDGDLKEMNYIKCKEDIAMDYLKYQNSII